MPTTLSTEQLVILVLLVLWTVPWKAVALWKSARRGEKAWFIVLLIVNTLAILEIIYIFGVVKEKNMTHDAQK